MNNQKGNTSRRQPSDFDRLVNQGYWLRRNASTMIKLQSQLGKPVWAEFPLPPKRDEKGNILVDKKTGEIIYDVNAVVQQVNMWIPTEDGQDTMWIGILPGFKWSGHANRHVEGVWITLDPNKEPDNIGSLEAALKIIIRANDFVRAQIRGLKEESGGRLPPEMHEEVEEALAEPVAR